MSNLDIPSKFTNKGTIINGSIGYDGKVTLGIEDNQGTIANNVGNMTELHLPNLKTSTGTIATGCPKLSNLDIPQLEEFHIAENIRIINSCTGIKELKFPKLKVIHSGGTNIGPWIGCKFDKLDLPSLEVWDGASGGTYVALFRDTSYRNETITLPALKRFSASGINTSLIMDTEYYYKHLYLPSLEKSTSISGGGIICGSYKSQTSQPKLQDIHIGCKGGRGDVIYLVARFADENVTDIELLNSPMQPIYINNFNGITEENTVNHILNVLGDNTQYTDKLTLTLPRAVYNKLSVEERDIVSNKNWSLAYV